MQTGTPESIEKKRRLVRQKLTRMKEMRDSLDRRDNIRDLEFVKDPQIYAVLEEDEEEE